MLISFYEISPKRLASHTHIFICRLFQIGTIGQNERHIYLAFRFLPFCNRYQMDWLRSHTWPLLTYVLNNSLSLPYFTQNFKAFINSRDLSSKNTFYSQPKADMNSASNAINTENKMSIMLFWFSLQDAEGLFSLLSYYRLFSKPQAEFVQEWE